ncbi:MAG: hypothetical protein Q9206_003220, partial [Seirophora lacunosa]
MALTTGSNCWCGDLLPAASSKTDDAKCDKSCQGGGDNAWSVLLTGLNNNVGSVQDTASNSDSKPKSSSKAATPPAPASTAATSTAAAKSNPTSPSAANAQPDTAKDKSPSTVTTAATVVVTAPGQTQPAAVSVESQRPSKGPNTGGIVAGVVVGIAAILAIAGGLFFFLRNRRRRAVVEQYQRNNVNNPFETESKPPQSSHSMSDSRLEPSVMMQRRQSDGSIADNQDYSRRILKVTNPDGVANGALDKSTPKSSHDGGQEKQKKLRKADAGHFSMIKYHHPFTPSTTQTCFCGFMSILSSMRYCLGSPQSHGPMWFALAFMPFGLFFDFMDGKVARWRQKSSLMGQELDSLADL